MSGKLFLISAPSGAGKTSLLEHVIKRINVLKRVVTYTTRKMRPTERQGVDYHFIPEEDFLEKLRIDFFVEHSTAYGSYYGFPRDILRAVDAGEQYIGVVDIAGAAAIKSVFNRVILIGIEPSDPQLLKERLLERNAELVEEVEARLQLAQEELKVLKSGFFNEVIINDDFESALSALTHVLTTKLTEI